MTKPSPVLPVQHDCSLLTDTDLHLFNEGTHYRLYDKMGAHVMEHGGRRGTQFAVWAPDAERVSVVGDFNAWDPGRHPLRPRGSSGIWEGFIPGLGPGTLYKYHVASRFHMYRVDKTDPYGFFQEVRPRTASIVWSLDYAWGDGEWMATRRRHNSHSAPVSIYEVHLGSWRRDPADPGRLLSYGEIAGPLVEHVKKLGFTHVELMPIMEYPFDGSWGYQTTGYFAPTSRHGNPQDFMTFVDTMHRNGIGVLLDWVPSHFPTDSHGLDYFDGTHLYEHADPRKGFHPDWKSNIFNYGRHEVRSFLLSSALFWLDKYHVDGLRVDAVASMLYLDYSRKDGEWIPNPYGGRENLEAIDLLRRLNAAAYGAHPDILMCAEESTAWPMVSRPAHVGGLGFGFKWDMGWMHDTLTYVVKEPIHRRFHHHQLSFRLIYAFNENFILPLSHDEVVHGKQSLLSKMPGDDWQKFANLRLLYGYMFAQPGKKLLFQGAEFGQWREWNYQESLDWHLAEFDRHQGIARWLGDLNRAYREDPALHELDCEPAGFEWIDCNDADNSVLSFVRKSRSGRQVVGVFNFTPVPREGYRIGLPLPGRYREILNSDAAAYGGSNLGNPGVLESDGTPAHGRPQSLRLTVPPLGAVLLRREDPA